MKTRTQRQSRDNDPLVLIVDGDSYERSRMARLAAGAGHNVEVAPSGLHAQRILGEKTVGLVITEQVMASGIDGLGLLLLIKSRWPRVRRAIATTRPRGVLVMQARIYADARTLLKPVPAEKLLSVIEEELRAYAG